MVDRIFGGLEIGVEMLTVMPWQQAIQTTAHATFDALRRHPKVAPLLIHHLPTGPNAMALRKTTITILLDTGFRPQLAGYIYAMITS